MPRLGRLRLPLVKMAWRNLRARPWRTLLTLFGIALGVAAVLATSITNRHAADTLAALFERTVGGCELQVLPAENRTTVDESFLEIVRQMPGVELAAPLLAADTNLPAASVTGLDSSPIGSSQIELAERLEVKGVELPLDAAMRVYELLEGRLPEPDRYEALVPEQLARQQQLSLGSEIVLSGLGATERVRIAGILANEGAATLNGGNVVFVPLELARTIFAPGSGYSEISIKTQSGIGDDPRALAELRDALQRRLPNTRVTYPAARNDQVPRMSSAYMMALAFFSILVVFMGAFLIYNTFAMSVLERTREIGMLRAIGMIKRQVMRQTLLEAALLAALGCLAGLVAGLALARGLMGLMRGFFSVEITHRYFTGADLAKSLGVGVAAALLAALLPAAHAARVTPMQALTVKSQSHQQVKPAVWQAGFALLAVGGGLMYWPATGPTQQLVAARLLAFVLVLAGAVLTLPLAVRLAEPASRRLSASLYGAMGVLGALNLRRSVSRTMVTIASLAISLLMIIEIGAIVFVLKRDVNNWLDVAVGADLVAQAPYPLRPSFADQLAAIEGVAAVSPSRTMQVQIAAVQSATGQEIQETVYLQAIDPVLFRQVADKSFVSGQGDPEAAWAQLAAGDALFVSSVVADRLGLRTGDTFTMDTRRGRQTMTVAGITTEFGQQGLVVTGAYADLRRLFGETRVDLFSISVRPGFDPEQVAAEIRARHEQREGLRVYATGYFRAQVMSFYDDLSSLFDVLGVIGVVIGALGLLNTMTMSVLERRRELSSLRAVGALRRQVVRCVLAEALIIGVISVLYAGGFGYILSRLLISAANLVSGYELRFSFSIRPYLICAAIGLGVSQLAALAPARHAAGAAISTALHQE